MTPVLELDGLTVHLGRRPVLRGVTASLEGHAIGLLGPNGAGKTTLIHTLLGFHRPASGTARVLGRDVVREPAAVRALTGYMPEQEAFIPGLTGVRLVRYLAELSGLPAGAALERAHEVLFFVGLGEARYRKVETYSLGMKQMIKLAQALVHAPRVLLLDEPTNGLDPEHRQRMLDTIREIRDRGDVRLLVSSHLLPDVEACCDEVLVLRDGRVASVCNLEEERRANRKFIELEVRGESEAFLEALGAQGIACSLEQRRIKMVLPESVTIRDLFKIAADRRIQIRRLQYKKDSLEEIFRKAMEDSHGGL